MGWFDAFKKGRGKPRGAGPPRPDSPETKVPKPPTTALPKAPADRVREELAKKIIVAAAEGRAIFAKALGSAFDGLQRPYIDFRSWRGVEVQLEFLTLYLVLTDRIARGMLGEERGVAFTKPLVQSAMGRTLEAVLLDETDPKAQAAFRTRAFTDLNSAGDAYAPFERILPSAPGNYKDSVVGHFGKRLASNLGAMLDATVMNTTMEIAKKGLAAIRIEDQIERISD